MCRWCRYAVGVVVSHYGIRFSAALTLHATLLVPIFFLFFFSFPSLFAWKYLGALSFFFIISSFVLFCFARNRFEFILDLASFCADKSEKLKRTAEICFVCVKSTQAQILLFSLSALTNYSSEECSVVCLCVCQDEGDEENGKKHFVEKKNEKKHWWITSTLWYIDEFFVIII